MGSEPTLLIYAALAALNAAQVALISGATWVHVLILASTAGLGAFLNRSQVAPTKGRRR